MLKEYFEDLASILEAAAPKGVSEGDDYSNCHNALATLVHARLKMSKYSWGMFLYPIHDRTCGETFNSKLAAQSAARITINEVYDKANSYFKPGSANCIAHRTAEWYAKRLSTEVDEILSGLKVLNGHDEQLSAIRELADNAQRVLQAQFEAELQESADYYGMYDRSYFLGKIELEDLGMDCDLFDSELVNGFLTLVSKKHEYMVNGIFEAVEVLEKDMSNHAATFYGEAHRLYRDYCAQIEKIAEEIGKDLSDDDLSKLGGAQDQSA